MEGQCERAAFLYLARMFPGCPPLDRPAVIGGIGESATADQIARRLARTIAFLQRDNSRIVVCIDRESRNETAAVFAADIEAALNRELPRCGGSAVPVTVVVADRAFEAWLLADAEGIAARHRVAPPSRRCWEGYMRPRPGTRAAGNYYGDDVLASMLGRYDKRRDGPRLFSELDTVTARAPCGPRTWGSRTLDRFLSAVGMV